MSKFKLAFKEVMDQPAMAALTPREERHAPAATGGGRFLS
jgi:hypothetical protein